MSTRKAGAPRTRRRTLLGLGLFAVAASVAAPAVAAPATRTETVAHQPAPSTLGTALAADSAKSLASVRSAIDVQRSFAVKAQRAARVQKARAHARKLAAQRASRARAHRLRVWRDSHARLIPVSVSYRLSARFGERSSLWGAGVHTGLDFDAPYGSTIRATRLGVVSFAGWAGPYGNCVVINHGNGLQTRYAHMSHISVKVGEFVWAGQQVGRLGGTGNTTGPHLHFEVIKNGKPIDPAKWLW